MKERPILFSGEMVRAILDGRKTQTRRVVKPDPDATWGYLAGDDADGPPALEWAHVTDGSLGHSGSGWYSTLSEYPDEGSFHFRCPYGAPGDQLWVRETWRDGQYAIGKEWDPDERVGYRASFVGDPALKWKPSIHMPRWASRLTLEVVSVRVERLQDITEADALAEGIQDGGCNNCGESSYPNPCGCANPEPLYVDAFAWLWNSINGKRAPWVLNPWVWVVTFKPL